MSEINCNTCIYTHIQLSGIVQKQLFGPRFIVFLTFNMTQVTLVDSNFIVNLGLFSDCLSCN